MRHFVGVHFNMNRVHFLLLFALYIVAESVHCPGNFSNWYGEKCSTNSQSNNHFMEKRQDCLALGADLLSIHSEEEDAVINKLFHGGFYWFGLGCDESNNPYWTDGTPVDYLNIDLPCAPNSAYLLTGGNEHWNLVDMNEPNRWSLCTLTVPHECGIGYELVDGTTTCVKTSALATTWSEAEASCARDGAHLVSIHSKQMNDYIRRLALSHEFVDGVFIGMQLVDRQTPSWTDKTTFDYDNFDTGMPNWMFGECAALQTHELLGRWTSMNCDAIDKLPYVCVRPITCPSNNTLEVQGEFFSPEYPNSVVTGLECEYYVAASPGSVVALRFLDISLQPGDSVKLFDGLASETPLAVVTNATTGDRFLTNESNVMKVVHSTSTVRGKRWWHVSFLSI